MSNHSCKIAGKISLPKHFAFCPSCGLQADGGNPYRQGFNPLTGELLIVFTSGDIQSALADHETGKTLSETDALQFMENQSSKLVDALLYQWSETIADLATAINFNPEKETEQ